MVALVADIGGGTSDYLGMRMYADRIECTVLLGVDNIGMVCNHHQFLLMPHISHRRGGF